MLGAFLHMARLMLVFASVLMLSSAAFAAAEPYDALVARAKAGDLAVDYRALRDAYAESAKYQPYGAGSDDLTEKMRKAFAAGDCAATLQSAQAIIDATFIDLGAHMLSARCNELDGNAERAAYHRAVAKGLLDSILNSGDGTTAKTAYIVVTIAEEYVVLSALGLHANGQALANDDGHVFDVIDTAPSAAGDARTVYFQIDRPMAWMSHSLEHP
jgi:Domain of unknown function (DUF4919)